ncbi:MAG: DUF4915 domain-containing protein, partial [Rhodoferax sp.]|nr:DUF4915 domain-containing protein [Rhodoferax sp.]
MPAAPAPGAPAVRITGSPGLPGWLARHGLSLAFSTYQTNRLFLVGVASSGRLAVNERLFDKPMGLCLQ